jgi:hypothetical protein
MSQLDGDVGIVTAACDGLRVDEDAAVGFGAQGCESRQMLSV